MTKQTLPSNVFNIEKTDYQDVDIILGQAPAMFDTINKKYPEIWRLYKTLRSMDWDANEFDYTSANEQFKNCDPITYDMMIKTLAWQWEGDSTVARLFMQVLSNVCTSDEAWAGWSRISENECYIKGTKVIIADGTEKDIETLSPNESVVVFDTSTNTTRIESYKKLIKKYYSGYMIEFKSDSFHQIVTPKHRMPFWNNETKQVEVKLAKDISISEAKNLISVDDLSIATDEHGTIHKLKNQVESKNMQINTFKYADYVYCLEVSTGFFVVNYEGVSTVGGNCLHAETYSEIVRNSFDDPNEILDEILAVQEAQDRLLVVAKVFSEARKASIQYANGDIENSQELYNKIYLFIVAVLCFERVQFMASFAVTFGICDGTGLFQPIGKAIQKIAQDEFEVHVQYGKAVLNYLHKSQRGQQARIDTEDEIIKLINEVTESEIEWTEWLFGDGRELTGVTCEMMKDWVYFGATDVGRFLGLEDKVNIKVVDENPLKYMEAWLDMSKMQASNQEEDTAQYKVNILRRDDEDDIFDF